jgi:uncharacterized protein YecE (DUF72 family)
LPAEGQFERWAEATPAGFRFAVTMSRQATSFGRIERLAACTQTIRVLGERLGPVRIKVPQARDDGFLLLLLDSLPFRYLRFRDPPYDEPALEAIAGELRHLVEAGTDAYCFFRHEDEPTAPAYADRLLELAGRSSTR